MVVPDHHPEDDHNIGVVHAAPPPLPEHVDRPDHFSDLGSERGRQTPPPVFGTEIRPTETVSSYCRHLTGWGTSDGERGGWELLPG